MLWRRFARRIWPQGWFFRVVSESGREPGRLRARRIDVLVMYNARDIQRPIAKQGLAVDVFLGDQSPDPGIAGVVAIVTHYEVVIGSHVDGRLAAVRQIQPLVKISLFNVTTVHAH